MNIHDQIEYKLRQSERKFDMICCVQKAYDLCES